jgi:hypothetical protein
MNLGTQRVGVRASADSLSAKPATRHRVSYCPSGPTAFTRVDSVGAHPMPWLFVAPKQEVIHFGYLNHFVVGRWSRRQCGLWSGQRTVKYSVTPATEARQVVEEIQFAPPVLVCPVMGRQVVLAVADSAAIPVASFNRVGHFAPVFGFQVLCVCCFGVGVHWRGIACKGGSEAKSPLSPEDRGRRKTARLGLVASHGDRTILGRGWYDCFFHSRSISPETGSSASRHYSSRSRNCTASRDTSNVSRRNAILRIALSPRRFSLAWSVRTTNQKRRLASKSTKNPGAFRPPGQSVLTESALFEDLNLRRTARVYKCKPSGKTTASPVGKLTTTHHEGYAPESISPIR